MIPLTTVTTVVEPIFVVPVEETGLEEEAGSKGGLEVEGIGVILEKVEVFGIVGMGVDEDDVDASDVGVVLVGVDDSSVVDCSGNDVVLGFEG